MGDTILLGQFCFDFAQFDAKAANFDLIVDAAAEGDIAVGVDGHGIAGAIQNGVDARAAEWIGDEFFRRQRRAVEIALRDAGPANQQFALAASLDEVQAFVHDIAAIIGDRPADGDGLIGAHFGHGCHDGGLCRAVGVVNGAVRAAPALAQSLRAGLAAQDNDAQARDIAGQQRQQCRHGVEHCHAGLFHHVGQPVGFAHDFGRGNEKGGSHQIGHPDLFHRQVESHRCALEHHVLRVDAVDFVGGAQVMADVGIADDDALGHAGRAGSVDQIGRVLAGCPQCPRIDFCSVAGIGQHQGCQHRAGDCGGFGGTRRRSQQNLGGAIIEADGNALDRRVGIEGQPGSAGHGNGNLGNQQCGAPRHPQADDIAGTNAVAQQATGNGGCCGIDLRIGQDFIARNHGDGKRLSGNSMRKNLAQKLVADQFWTQGTAQDRQRAPWHVERRIRHMRARILSLRNLRVIWHHGDHCPFSAGFFA